MPAIKKNNYICKSIKEKQGIHVKQTIQTYILLTVCIIMQAVSVFPHHHHGNRFCFNMEKALSTITYCCSNPSHSHQHAEDTHTCDAACITHIQCHPQDQISATVSPDYSFCSILYSFVQITGLLWPDTPSALLSTCYIEKLHGSPYTQIHGLRAPPCC